MTRLCLPVSEAFRRRQAELLPLAGALEVKDAAGPVGATEASVKNVALEMKVKNILLTHIGVNALKIEVEAVDGVVSLRGKLDSPDTSKAAIKKTRSIKGVKKVVDLLS